MSWFMQGLKAFCRRKKYSLISVLIFFVILSALVFSSLIMNVCDVYKARNENPYSDYYRLLSDRKVTHEEMGYVSYDKMYSGSWFHLQQIDDYFYDIEDYTAEVYGQTTADIKPYLPEWMKDKGLFLLYGLTDCMELTEFAKGELSLTEGRYLSSEDRYENKKVCIINEEIAALNELALSDKIKIKMNDGTDEEYSIVGIYKNNVPQPEANAYLSYDLPQNRIFVPLSTFEKAYGMGCYNYQIKLKDDSLADDIASYISSHGMCDGYDAYLIKVFDLFETSNKTVHALEDALLIAQWAFVFVSAVLTFIFVRSSVASRKRELGVYLALGKSKTCVTASLLTELLLSVCISAVAAVTLASSFGADLSKGVLTEVLDNTSVEALRITTSDTVQVMAQEKVALSSFFGGDFVKESILGGFGAFFAVAVVGALVSAVEVFRIKLVNLLTSSEDI